MKLRQVKLTRDIGLFTWPLESYSCETSARVDWTFAEAYKSPEVVYDFVIGLIEAR